MEDLQSLQEHEGPDQCRISFLNIEKFSADLKFSGTWFQSLAPSWVIPFNPNVAEFILDNEILFLSNIATRSQTKFFHAGRIQFIESFYASFAFS